MAITREWIKSGEGRRRILEQYPDFPLLPVEEVEASRRSTLAHHPADQPLWVFAYGSLMWNPAFHHDGDLVGQVYGYHRRFCLWTTLGRGSPDRPGLMLALDRGGSCKGMALRIAPECVEEETQVIWGREMITASYVPTWMTVHTGGGRVRAVGFVINRKTERYAGALGFEDTARAMARADCGHLGTCYEYLCSTVTHLEEVGIHDVGLTRLRRAVKDLLAPEAPGAAASD
jgi:cation transport protein ChaC